MSKRQTGIEDPAFQYIPSETHAAQGAGINMLKRHGFKPTTAAERRERQLRAAAAKQIAPQAPAQVPQRIKLVK